MSLSDERCKAQKNPRELPHYHEEEVKASIKELGKRIDSMEKALKEDFGVNGFNNLNILKNGVREIFGDKLVQVSEEAEP